jgi:hypothetical protein
LPRAYRPATFRLQGLATLLTAYSLRSRAGFLSHRQRSWDSPFGAFSSRKVFRAFPPERAHLLFRRSVLPPPKRGAGPTGRSSWASTLPRVPGDRRAFDPPAAGCSLGLHPSRVLQRQPCPGFHPVSSHALHEPSDKPPNPPAPQSIDRPPPSPHHAPRRSATDGRENPLRVFAPAQSQSFARPPIRAMCSPLAALAITGRIRRSLDGPPRATGVAGTQPRCRLVFMKYNIFRIWLVFWCCINTIPYPASNNNNNNICYKLLWLLRV